MPAQKLSVEGDWKPGERFSQSQADDFDRRPSSDAFERRSFSLSAAARSS